MPGRALDEPTLAAPVVQGTKRKVSCMEDINPSQEESRTHPPIKLELGSPNENDGTTSVGQTEAQLASEARLDKLSGDMLVASRPKADIDTARVPLHDSEQANNGLLRPSPVLNALPPSRWQKAFQRPNPSSRPSKVTVGDVVYNSIPDYAPPISTLPPGTPHILKVYWPQKTVIDLSDDPDRHMLHEAEIQLATSLNLSCAKYLCTKRRIFQARFKALQEGKESWKSDSQKACKINTNKASKMYAAFEKVGWFDKKHFFRYLEDINNKSRKSDNDTKHRSSACSELNELDIWDLSESEFHFTSEGDDESTDEDTADSSVSFDGRCNETSGRKGLESHPHLLPRKQPLEFSATGEVENKGIVCNDKRVQTSNTLSMDETGDEGSMTEERQPERGLVLNKASYRSEPAGPSADDTEDVPLLETGSMTQKLKFAQIRQSEDISVSLGTVDSHQKSASEESHRRPARTNHFALRNAIPKSLDEAIAADVMLVKMMEESRPWAEIEEAWEKTTGKAQAKKSLLRRYSRIMENLASTSLRADEKPDKSCSLTLSLPKSPDDQSLLNAEAEIEGNFQREKADILAEMERNFQSVKWDLIAEAMSRAGSATYSAESVEAQYEKLTNTSKEAAAKKESKREAFTDLSRQTPRAVEGGKFEMSTPSRSGPGRLDGASNTTTSPADGVEHGHQTVRKRRPPNHAEHSARMRKVWAKRQALGTNGHHGGPPKARTITKQAKIAFPNTKPNAGSSLAPAVVCPSGHAQESLSHQNQPIIVEDQVGRDANQHRHSLARVVPAAALVGNGLKHTKPPRKLSM